MATGEPGLVLLEYEDFALKYVVDRGNAIKGYEEVLKIKKNKTQLPLHYKIPIKIIRKLVISLIIIV